MQFEGAGAVGAPPFVELRQRGLTVFIKTGQTIEIGPELEAVLKDGRHIRAVFAFEVGDLLTPIDDGVQSLRVAFCIFSGGANRTGDVAEFFLGVAEPVQDAGEGAEPIQCRDGFTDRVEHPIGEQLSGPATVISNASRLAKFVLSAR